MDNGVGMSAEALEALKNSAMNDGGEHSRRDSIGVKNIYERIKLFDKRNEMYFSSKEGEFTKVEMVLYHANIHK